MINYFMQKSAALTISAVLMFVFYSNAFAATECRFSGEFTPSVNVTDSAPVSFLPKTGAAIRLREWTYLMNIYSRCSVGSDGNDLYSKRGTNIVPNHDNTGVALFDTNIPGIYYSVEMGTNGGSARGALYAVNSEQQVSLNQSQVEDKQWNIIITLYQRPEYDGIPVGTTSVNLKQTGYIGYFRVGEMDGDNKAIDINMTSMSVPIVVPTCTSLVSSVGSGAVDLGSNYEIDDLKNNKTTQVGFVITASQCSNAIRYKTKLTANDAYQGLLTNNSSASLRAGGVGVKILAPNGSQLLANDSQSVYTETAATMPRSKTFNYTAQLITSGDGAISAGDFKATGTFSVSYE